PGAVRRAKPLCHAPAMGGGGSPTGVLAKGRRGRPLRAEATPDHPASLGATDAFAQASVLTLYDPDRSRSVRHLGRPSDWTAALEQLGKLRRDPDRGGAADGVYLLTESVTSPTLADQLAQLFGDKHSRWHRYQPV